MKALACVLAIGQDTREERSGQTAIRDALLIRTRWVREGDAWWARGADRSFVDVCCCEGGRFVLACYARECDVLSRIWISLESRGVRIGLGWVWRT